MSISLLRRFPQALALAGFALLAAPALHADEHDRRVVITNETSYAIVEFYASRVSTDSWEEDLLGDRVLRSGEAGVFNFDDGTGACLFDFKAVFSDGDVVYSQGVNTCKLANYYFRE